MLVKILTAEEKIWCLKSIFPRKSISNFTIIWNKFQATRGDTIDLRILLIFSEFLELCLCAVSKCRDWYLHHFQWLDRIESSYTVD